jgi:hypothetical protein
MNNRQSQYKDQVIGHMSTQLCHFENLTKAYLGTRSYQDTQSLDKLSILRDLFEHVLQRFNYEAERMRLLNNLSDLEF